MRQKFLAYGAALFLIIIACGIFLFFRSRAQKISVGIVAVGDERLYVEYALAPREWTRGLMYREGLAEDHGMLFVFPDSLSRAFWNQNTYLPLDIIWINGGQVIGVSELPSVRDRGVVSAYSPGPAEFVLEVNHGWIERHGIETGTPVSQIIVENEIHR